MRLSKQSRHGWKRKNWGEAVWKMRQKPNITKDTQVASELPVREGEKGGGKGAEAFLDGPARLEPPVVANGLGYLIG